MFNFINESANKTMKQFGKTFLIALLSKRCNVYATANNGFLTPLAMLSNENITSLSEQLSMFPQVKFNSEHRYTFLEIRFLGKESFEDDCIEIYGVNNGKPCDVDMASTYNVNAYTHGHLDEEGWLINEGVDNLFLDDVAEYVAGKIEDYLGPFAKELNDYCSVEKIKEHIVEMEDYIKEVSQPDHQFTQLANQGMTKFLDRAIKFCNTRIKEANNILRILQ